MERLVNAKGELITSGLHPGTGNSQIPLWATGSNVVFKDGSVKPGPQQSLIFNKSSGLLGIGIRSIDNQGEGALVWGTRQSLYRGVSIPTSVDATRAGTVINDLDTDSGNWVADANTTVSDDARAAPGGTGGSLQFEGKAASTLEYAARDLAAGPTDLTGKTLTIWFQCETEITYDKLSAGGDAVRIKLSSELEAVGTNWNEYYFSKTLISTWGSWVQIVLDLSTEEADDSNGTLVISAVKSIALSIKLVSNATINDRFYWDELSIAGFYTGTNLDRWSIVQFGQSVLASNGIDEVQYLADITTGVFQNLSDAGGDLASSFRAAILQKLGPYIIAFNTDNDNTEARWCTEDNVLVWTPIASNSARDINLRDMNSSIKCVIEFGNSLLVIGDTRAHIFQFVGAPFFFGAQKLIDGIGAVSKNAVCESGRMVFGFSAHGIWVSDGAVKNYIDEPDIHSFIYEGDKRYDKGRAELVCAWEDSNDDEIYFSYPTVDEYGFTVSFAPKSQVWSLHDYWRTAASPGELWKAAVLLSNTGDVFVQSESGTGSTFDVNPLGLSDELIILLGMGEAAMGEGPYGGEVVVD